MNGSITIHHWESSGQYAVKVLTLHEEPDGRIWGTDALHYFKNKSEANKWFDGVFSDFPLNEYAVEVIQ